jgi:hypothetical protein
MIEEIGRLGRETFVVLRICRHYHFHRFLAHLLRGLPDALGQQFSRVGPFGPASRALSDGSGQAAQQMPARILLLSVPASPVRRVTA